MGKGFFVDGFLASGIPYFPIPALIRLMVLSHVASRKAFVYCGDHHYQPADQTADNVMTVNTSALLLTAIVVF